MDVFCLYSVIDLDDIASRFFAKHFWIAWESITIGVRTRETKVQFFWQKSIAIVLNALIWATTVQATGLSFFFIEVFCLVF